MVAIITTGMVAVISTGTIVISVANAAAALGASRSTIADLSLAWGPPTTASRVRDTLAAGHDVRRYGKELLMLRLLSQDL